MKKLLASFLWFSFCLILLLPVAYLFIIYLFHQELVFNKPKLAEEASKVAASFLLAIISLGFSQIGEQMKTKRRADALAALIISRLKTEQDNIVALSTAAQPPVQENIIEDLRINKEFHESLQDRIESLSQTVNEAQQLFSKSEPEVVYLCNHFAVAISQVTASINSYSTKPSRDRLEQFRHSLQTLQGIIKG